MRRLRGLAAALLLASAPVLTACAANSYAGIPLRSGAADPELQSLARRAQAGDKHAQLELGIRYEEGRGTRIDLERAERLYRMAARDRPGVMQVYSPPVGEGDRGRVISVAVEPAPGLPAAKARLERLTSGPEGEL